MGVASWGYGTGSTGGTAWPFGLRINGVEYIRSVPLDSISVNSSVSSNATLTFTVVEEVASLPIPTGWSDVEFIDYGGTTVTAGAWDEDSFDADSFGGGTATAADAAEWIFGGLVMGVEVSHFATLGRQMAIRCVGYGFLLDRAPLLEDLSYTMLSTDGSQYVVSLAGNFPLGGITAGKITMYQQPGRVLWAFYNGSDVSIWAWYPQGSVQSWARGTSARSALDTISSRLRVAWSNDDPGPRARVAPGAFWVDPLKRLSFLVPGTHFGVIDTEIRVNPTTSAHVAAGEIVVEQSSTEIESITYVDDLNNGAESGWVGGGINGYTSGMGTVSENVSAYYFDAQWAAEWQTAPRSTTTDVSCTVDTTVNFPVGYGVTVYYPSLDLDGVYVITAASVSFLGGSLRRWRLELEEAAVLNTDRRTRIFSRPHRTLPAYIRTRFARAGVTT